MDETQAQLQSKHTLAAEILRSGGSLRIRALGNSMLPSLWPGDLLTIESANTGEVSLGDIVLVERQGRFYLHRVVRSLRDAGGLYWITRGDAMPQADWPAAPDEVLGRVSAIHRKHKLFFPSRQLSLLRRILATMLCHWDSFRNLTLRLHGIREAGERTLDPVSVGET